MNRSYLRILAVSALALSASQAMASNNSDDYYANNPFGKPAAAAPKQDKDLDDFQLIAADQAPAVVAQAASYEQEAKILGAKIVAGFKATSPAGWLTSFVSKCTAVYAGLVLGADSISEGYLQMGKEDGLDLSNLRAVYNHLSSTFARRITGNVEKGASIVPLKYVDYVGKGLNIGGNKYYNYRLAKALQWVYEQDMKKEMKLYHDPELPLELLEAIQETAPVNVNNSNHAVEVVSVDAVCRQLQDLTRSGEDSEARRAEIGRLIDVALAGAEPIEDLIKKTDDLAESLETFKVKPKSTDEN